MKTILTTGGAGFIGSHTIIELLQAGFDVVSVDDHSNSTPEVYEIIHSLTGKHVTHYLSDVCDEAALSEIVSRHTVDGAIHFAGFKAVGESVERPLMYYRNNLDSTLSLCSVCLEHNINSIVFSSSATVYGLPQYLPLDEEHPLSTTNPYGNTKLFIEHILRDVAAPHPHLNVALLRYFNPVGAHPSGRLGERPKDIPNNLMPYLTQTAAGIRDHLSVFGNDYETEDGTCVRDFIHVVDLAKGHVAALRKLDENPGTVVYNLGTGKGTSVLELLNAFMKVNEVDVPYVFAPRRPGDVPVNYADSSKAEQELGWKAELGIEDMVRDSWRWEKANR